MINVSRELSERIRSIIAALGPISNVPEDVVGGITWTGKASGTIAVEIVMKLRKGGEPFWVSCGEVYEDNVTLYRAGELLRLASLKHRCPTYWLSGSKDVANMLSGYSGVSVFASMINGIGHRDKKVSRVNEMIAAKTWSRERGTCPVLARELTNAQGGVLKLVHPTIEALGTVLLSIEDPDEAERNAPENRPTSRMVDGRLRDDPEATQARWRLAKFGGDEEEANATAEDEEEAVNEQLRAQGMPHRVRNGKLVLLKSQDPAVRRQHLESFRQILISLESQGQTINEEILAKSWSSLSADDLRYLLSR